MSWIDYFVIVVYLGIVIAVGLLTRGKQDSAEDYFSGSAGGMKGRLGAIIVGLSIAATFFSGISFVAIPSIMVSTGTSVLFLLVALIPSVFVVSLWFIPKYLSFQSRHPYEIIAVRMGDGVRSVTSALYIMLRLGWMASLIYAPTIVLMTVLGLGTEWLWPILLIVGLVSTGYTVFSGLRGVVMTDAIQMLIIIASLVTAMIFALSQIPFTPAAWVSQLSELDKLTVPSFSLSLTERFTIWGILVGISISNLAVYIGDQMSLQRYITTENARAAQHSFAANVAGVVGVLSLLMGMGLVILLWYSYHPEIPMPENPDQVFPAFISTVLPAGLGGLMAAAILAATMSSITSGINALAGAITMDFLQPIMRNAKPKTFLVIGRWLSLGIGVFCTLGAGLAANLGTIYDVSQAILGVFLGPILGVVILAVCGARIPQPRMIVAVVLACLCGLTIAFSGVQTIWVTTFGFVPCVIIALLPIGSRQT